MMLRIDIHRWFAMAAIFNPKCPSKNKNHPIWTKFGFQSFWKFQDLNAPLELGIHLPVKFSKDRIISL
jgi:hypothetical protein